MKIFNKVAIIGVGLIGGSIGLALKKRKLATEVIGICRREPSRKKAIKFKAVDEATLDFQGGIKGADLVIIAAPVGKIVNLAKTAVKFMKKSAILTDVGSTKKYIVNSVEKIASGRTNFVGSHPMAGSEKSGVEFSSDKLFEDSICIVTRTKKTNKKAFNTVKKFWNKIGARCEKLSPEMHDKYIASVSHLPHLAAAALVGSVEKNSLKYASTGFKDTTRIASSSPELWRDIFMTNKHALMHSLSEYKKALEAIKRSIDRGKKKELSLHLKRAKKIRDYIR